MELDTMQGPHFVYIPRIVGVIAEHSAEDVFVLFSMKSVCKVWRDVLDDENLWRDLVHRRYGQDETVAEALPNGCPLGPWQARFLDLANNVNALSGSNGDICWGGSPQYYTKASHPGGKSEICMVLNHVWWLEVNSWWKGVTAGTYRVVWRMRILPGATGITDLKMEASISAGLDKNGRAMVRVEGRDPEHIRMRMVPAAGGRPARLEDTKALATPQPTQMSKSEDKAKVKPSAFGVALSALRAIFKDTEVKEQSHASPDCHTTAQTPGRTGPSSDWWLFRKVVRGEELKKLADASPDRWINVEAGRFTVPLGCVYDVKAYQHDFASTCKQGFVWDNASLKPVVG